MSRTTPILRCARRAALAITALSAAITLAGSGGTSAAATPIDVSGPVESDPLLGWNPAFLEAGIGTPGTDCVLPTWQLDPAAAEAYYRAAIACHDAAWAPVFAYFEITPTAPQLWAGAEGAAYVGACGANTTGREAFYCNLDDTMVMPFDSMRTIAEFGEGYALAVLSHEYGHYLQDQFGIIDAYVARRQAVGWESDAGQLLSRQLELQAWCLSGMFYGTSTGRGSITQELSDQAFDNNTHAGDRPGELREHGTNASIASWFGWGRHPSDDPAAAVVPTLYECNSWAAREASTLE